MDVAKEVAEGQEEPQGEESAGWEDKTEGVPGGVPEGESGDVLGNELENGAGVEDSTGEERPHSASLPVRDRVTNMTPLCPRHVNQHWPI
ncbi:hypothetical protein ID866_12119 [Astraeus odoratus]|nr:hypothetical protein ID866_12119 [Astraeus odoratus]